ncbi:class I SAM-dependent methyltransferase [Mycolicibacterium sp. P1-18]|uniref:SAM-dependent methyltransferase n=1 Tax=Mycolicibacterium sp. P1-18 TaxID=2024615 RepID=UPI0011F25F50|nr:class I SAM-dependent methyltransferase [Mycolicibacterium sp. P1-18]KAA0095990.1 class I SAM-dependent methyltransferase [Mycolicibacterium sp. P1-18]
MELPRVKTWSASAQALALLTAVHERRWTSYLTEPRDLDELAQFTTLPIARLRDVVGALQAVGVVQLTDLKVVLTPEYAALLSDDAPFSLDGLLDEAQMMSRLVADAVHGVSPGSESALTLANAYGLRPTAAARAMFGQLLEALPDFREALNAGRYLDVGCGVGSFVLSTAQSLPALRAVGVELVPTVAAEAARRAEALGVADRVQIRCMDARDLDEEDQFDSAFWAQPFFPTDSRPPTLAAIRRALKPGAKLFMQELERVPDTDAERSAFTLRRLVFTGWGVPFARSAEDLTAEAEAAGFVLDRVASTPFGRIVVSRA